MAIDKLIPQYLSSDTDQKLVKSVEMTDNLNVRVSNNDEGTAGVLKNVKGTDLVGPKTPSDEIPSGENRVIGSVANEKSNEVLFFLWNSDGNHGIYRLDTLVDKFTKVYEDAVLGFEKLAFVDCDVVINEEEETLLYWTDNINPPMKLNINRVLSGGYPASLTSGTDEEKLEALTVAKRPPQNPITFEYDTDDSVRQNNLKDYMFQFAYQYIYEDGEVSAISPYSKVAFSVSQTLRGVSSEGSTLSDNLLRLYITSGNENVKKVRVLGRIGNTGQLFQIKEIDNGPSLTLDFYNDSIYPFVSTDESSKMFDNVPVKAKTLTVSNNRLMYGNYVEGYDNIDLDTDSYPVYRRLPNTYGISSDINPLVAGNTVEARWQTTDTGSNITDDVSFNIDFSALPSTIKKGTLVSFDIQLGVTEVLEYFIGSDSVGSANAIEVVEFDWDDDGTTKTATVFLGGQLSSPILFAPSPFTVSFSKTYAADTSKASVVADIISSLNNKSHTTTVSPDFTKSLHATQVSSFDMWFSGKASFLTKNGVYDSVSEVATFDVSFNGADLYISRLTQGGKDRDIISGGSVELPSYDYLVSIYSGFIYLHYYEYKNFFTSSSIAEDLALSGSFKTKANHEFGIVYYDDRNRSGGVNKLPTKYVAGYSESERLGNLGAVEFDFRIKHNAPSWAKKWQLVYTKNTTYDDFLQYSVSEAFVATNTDSSTTITGSEGNRIYISARSLEGKENSYKEGKGARIEYKFEEGDTLRIIKYEDGFTRRPMNFEFRILGYEYLSDDESNPLVVSAQRGFRQTGWFLVLSDENYEGFSYQEILSDSDLWGQNCLVEICKPQKALEEKVYYEIGNVYDVTNGVHSGDRDTSATTNAAISISYAGLERGFGESLYRFYVGDELNIGTHIITIESIRYQSNGYIGYEFSYKSPVQITAGPYLCTIYNYEEAVVTLTDGDVYFRPRNIRYNPFDSVNSVYDETSSSSTVYQLEYVEDYALNDFFSSKSISIGRPQVYSPEFKQIRRRASITYSDAYVIDSDRLNLSSFNLSLANWTDLSLEFGQIDRIISRGDAITVLQESKASQLPVGRNIIEYANGDAGVTVSKNVLGVPSYYAGNFGTSGNPESVIERFGIVYYTDLNSRKVIRLSADGITPISDKGMDSYFQSLFEDLDKNVSIPKVVGGFDPDNDEYLITIEDFSQSVVSVNGVDYEVELNDDNEYAVIPTYTSSTILWNEINANWNSICIDWDNLGDAILYLDTSTLYVDSLLSGSTGSITVLVTDTNWSFVAEATIELGTNVVTFPTQTCDGNPITINFGGSEHAGVTIGFKHKANVWSSKYSFLPTNYANIGNALYSFFDNDNGTVWRHNVNDTRNNFYGTQYESMFEVVSNYNPSMVKTYQAMGIEGGGTWECRVDTASQRTNITEFDEREGHRYAMIPRDIINSKGHQIFLGIVDSVNNNDVTFTTPINKLPFVVGDTLKVASGSSLNTTGVSIVSLLDRKTIKCSGSNVNVGDKVFVEHSSIVDGDPMRDVYATFKLTSQDTDPFEVHAVSVHFDRSRLHNDRVN